MAGLDTLGAKGLYLWIWDNADVDDVINTGVTPKSKGCTPNSTEVLVICSRCCKL